MRERISTEDAENDIDEGEWRSDIHDVDNNDGKDDKKRQQRNIDMSKNDDQ